jgi:hypothetical protein
LCNGGGEDIQVEIRDAPTGEAWAQIVPIIEHIQDGARQVTGDLELLLLVVVEG